MRADDGPRIRDSAPSQGRRGADEGMAGTRRPARRSRPRRARAPPRARRFHPARGLRLLRPARWAAGRVGVAAPLPRGAQGRGASPVKLHGLRHARDSPNASTCSSPTTKSSSTSSTSPRPSSWPRRKPPRSTRSCHSTARSTGSRLSRGANRDLPVAWPRNADSARVRPSRTWAATRRIRADCSSQISRSDGALGHGRSGPYAGAWADAVSAAADLVVEHGWARADPCEIRYRLDVVVCRARTAMKMTSGAGPSAPGSPCTQYHVEPPSH